MDGTRFDSENGGGMAGLVVGLGMLTMALFPLAIPMIALLAALAIPFVPIALAAAMVTLAWRGMRALRSTD